MEHHGFAKREGSGMGRVVNWAQVCAFLNFHAISWTGENADPNLQSKVW